MKHCTNCEIVYTEQDCPLCEATLKIERLERDIENLESENIDLQEQLDNLKDDINRMGAE